MFAAVLRVFEFIGIGPLRWFVSWMPFTWKSRGRIVFHGSKVIPQSSNRWLEVTFVYEGPSPKNPLTGEVRIFDSRGHRVSNQLLVESDTWASKITPASNGPFRLTVATDLGQGSDFFALGPQSLKYEKWADPVLKLTDGSYEIEIAFTPFGSRHPTFAGELKHSDAGFESLSLLKRNVPRCKRRA